VPFGAVVYLRDKSERELLTVRVCLRVKRMLVHMALTTVSLTRRKLTQSAPYVECMVIDCGDCSWPWQWFVLMQNGSPLFVTSNRSIFIWNEFGWSEIVSCASEITTLFSVLFYVVRALRKFEFRLVINQKKLHCGITETRVFDRLSMFYPKCRREC